MSETKEILQARIKQNRKDVEKLQAEGCWLEKELNEAKPKLRHMDYGMDSDGVYFRIAIRPEGSDHVDVWNDCGVKNPSGRNPETDIWLGNLWDDLKRNSEDLTEVYKDRAAIGLRIKDTSIQLYASTCGICNKNGSDGGGWCDFNIQNAVYFHQNLGQMIATKQREDAKKGVRV